MKLKVNKDCNLGKIGNTIYNLKKGETVDLPANKTVKSYINSGILEKLESKTNSDFENRLLEIEGVGKKTVKDILEIADTENKLRELVRKDKLPFDDDIEKKLKEEFK